MAQPPAQWLNGLLSAALLSITVMLAPPRGSAGQSQDTCPGITTAAMTACASQALQRSDARLQQHLSSGALRQWQHTTIAVCEAAHASSKGGSIYPLQILGCRDALNKTLLQQFQTPDH